MGLDITAYRNLTLVGPAAGHPVLESDADVDDETVDDFYDNHVVTQFSPFFPHAAEGLPSEGVEVDPNRSWTPAYVYSEREAESLHWRAGSYLGYGVFRDRLAELGGYTLEEVWENIPAYRDKPFFELVHFADNEGTLGPVPIRNLLEDFTEFREQFRELVGEDSWMAEAYDEWIEGLTFASDGGILIFS